MPIPGVEFAKVSYTPADGRTILHDISLQLEAGKVTALLGRSGSGKTTLLRTVNGLVRPTSGEVRVNGAAVGQSDLLHLRQGIGYVIQETGLFPHMTVERNAGLPLEIAGRSKTEIAARVREVLKLAGLDFDEFHDRYPWQLSGGQRQRVGLARALSTDPAVLLMDEPFGALDPLTRAEMQTMLRELLQRVQKTVVVVTHDLNEALYLARRAVFLRNGVVAADLLTSEVLHSPQSEVRDYVNSVNRTF